MRAKVDKIQDKLAKCNLFILWGVLRNFKSFTVYLPRVFLLFPPIRFHSTLIALSLTHKRRFIHAELRSEMEMDIPMPDELEWLEADLQLHEEYLDEDPEPPPLPEEEASYIEEVYEALQPEPIVKPALPIPEKVQPKKRFRPLSPNLLDPSNVDDSVEDKRCKVNDSSAIEADDDWLRYSPPPQEESVVIVEEEKETFISRYVTDIEGDFMPVTAPDGDRVYAKLVKEEKDGKLKKLDVKAPSKGRVLLTWLISTVKFGCLSVIVV